jgi:soluble lytic murein transglycosylase-like protein
VHKVVQRESDYRPAARNGPYYGMMQILPATARGMGFQGRPEDLLDAETNLTYAVKYLRGAWLVSDGDMDSAVMWYARGYYYEARDRCLLVATGLRTSEVAKHCR